MSTRFSCLGCELNFIPFCFNTQSGDASQGELLGACVEGLTTLWYYYPFFDSFDPRA